MIPSRTNHALTGSTELSLPFILRSEVPHWKQKAGIRGVIPHCGSQGMCSPARASLRNKMPSPLTMLCLSAVQSTAHLSHSPGPGLPAIDDTACPFLIKHQHAVLSHEAVHQLTDIKTSENQEHCENYHAHNLGFKL